MRASALFALRLVLIVTLAIGVAWLAKYNSLWFAALAAIAAFRAALTMERQRLDFEFPFYFSNEPGRLARSYIFVSSGISTLFKTVLTGGLALLFFSGTRIKESLGRIETTALAFGICLIISVILIQVLRHYNPVVRRWGFFRLVLPLGLLYSVLIHLWPKQQSIWFWNNIEPAGCLRPARYKSLGGASDCYFEVSQTIDKIIETILKELALPGTNIGMPDVLVDIMTVFGSANLAMGLVLAPLSVLLLDIANIGRKEAASAPTGQSDQARDSNS